MKITNPNNIPSSIFAFLETDFYDHGDAKGTLTATTLLKPTQEIILTKRHNDEIEVNAMDRLWSLFGSGVHAALEKINEKEGAEPIERLKADANGYVISGKFDRIKDGKIYDYKCTSAWTLVFGGREEEWATQLSIYRWLYWKQKGIILSETGYIIAILRDWSETDYERDRAKGGARYPSCPIVELPFTLSKFPDIEQFIVRKTSQVKVYEALPDNQLPPCTDDERWYNAKKDRYVKCERYCSARKFCHQGGQSLHA